MNQRPTMQSSSDPSEGNDDSTPASEQETRSALLDRSGRPFAPIPKVFVQNPNQKLIDRSAPLSLFVQNGDLRALRAFCLLHAIISSGDGDNGWSTTLPISTWARAFDTTRTAEPRSASSAASKILGRLEARRLIQRTRHGRARRVTVTLLRPDGSGAAYTRPGKANDDRFLRLPNEFWTEDWYEKLDLPATTMLLVALHEKPAFELTTERIPGWYGWSPDTAERGLKSLEGLGLLAKRQRLKKTPLSPTGQSKVNVYTLLPPFAHTAPSLAPKKSLARKKRAKTKARAS